MPVRSPSRKVSGFSQSLQCTLLRLRKSATFVRSTHFFMRGSVQILSKKYRPFLRTVFRCSSATRSLTDAVLGSGFSSRSQSMLLTSGVHSGTKIEDDDEEDDEEEDDEEEEVTALESIATTTRITDKRTSTLHSVVR